MNGYRTPEIGRIEVYERAGQHWVRLEGGAGSLLVQSGPHRRYEEALDIASRLEKTAPRFRGRMSAQGLFYFTAQADDGEILATSPMFEVPAERDEALATAERLLATARVVVVHRSSPSEQATDDTTRR